MVIATKIRERPDMSQIHGGRIPAGLGYGSQSSM